MLMCLLFIYNHENNVHVFTSGVKEVLSPSKDACTATVWSLTE